MPSIPPNRILVSFDIDGTLEDGDPPGPVPFALVRQALDLGYIVGSASDRTLREQRLMWNRRGVVVDFVSHKHHLHKIAADFPAERMVHVGDTDVDAHYARLAGFQFYHVATLPSPGDHDWIF